MASTASTRMNSRRRPLITCGVSASAIAHKSYRKVLDLNEPLELKAKMVTKILGFLVSSLVYVLQNLCVAIVSYMDDCILSLEGKVESILPVSKHVFNKVDEGVQMIETLPGKFDDVLEKIPVIIPRVSFLDWALSQAISLLKLLTSLLNHWSTGNERDIGVDTTGYNGRNVASVAAKKPRGSTSQRGDENEENFPSVSEKPKTQSEKVGDKANPAAGKETYKEVLERGKGEDTKQKQTKKGAKKDKKPNTDEVDQASKKDGSGTELRNGSLIDLFDSGWHSQNSVKNAIEIESSLPRSVSYT